MEEHDHGSRSNISRSAPTTWKKPRPSTKKPSASNKSASARAAFILTDGHLNIAILSFRSVVEGETMKLGVDHIGFQVDDVDAAVARIKELGGKSLNHRNEVSRGDPAQPQSYFEVKCIGPEDQIIDVSNAGWVGAK